VIRQRNTQRKIQWEKP